MNPIPNNPSVATVAYSRASSKAGGPAALSPSSPVNTVSPPEVEEVAVDDAVAVELTLFVTGSVAPHGLSCWQAPWQVLLLSHAVTHWLTYSTQTK